MSERWRDEAKARIEKLRQGDFILRLQDEAGQALAGTPVHLRQTRSHFRFGTAIAGHPLRETPDAQAYRRFIVAHFNTLVCENAMKWYATEKQRDEFSYEEADLLLRWAEVNGLAMRGHCLFWEKQEFVQPWLQGLDDGALRACLERRLQAIVPRYRGRLIAWDVNNEMLDGRYYRERLGAAIHAWMFRRARELDPQAPLFVNDYNLIGHPDRTQAYLAQVQDLEQQGAVVGGIGVQEHGCEQFGPTGQQAAGAQKIWAALEALGQAGRPIHLTEISSRHADERVRADGLEVLVRTGFSHGSVEAILVWGFWAGRHWLGPEAALVGKDWKLTAAGERLAALLLEEWRTTTSVRSDPRGVAAFRGFFGTYHVEVEGADGRPQCGVVEMTPAASEATVVVKVQGAG